jgi:cytochrome c peroxidase
VRRGGTGRRFRAERLTRARLIAASAFLVSACHAMSTPLFSAADIEVIETLSLGEAPGTPSEDERLRAKLGHRLFFDRGLSANGRVACASCHRPEAYFTDGRARALGITQLARNTPTVIGSDVFGFMTWDGKKDSLWAQSIAPMLAKDEMGGTRTRVARRIAAVHRAEYEAAFGPLPALDDEARYPFDAEPDPERPALMRAGHRMGEGERRAVTAVLVNAGRALEAYQRRLRPERSRFDRFAEAIGRGALDGDGQLTRAEQRGLAIFLTKGQCIHCHHGPHFTDGEFHNLGLPNPERDIGRAFGLRAVKADPFRCGGAWRADEDCAILGYLDPEFPDFEGAFKTPSLRNVAETSPYMHGGQLGTLDEVVAFYRMRPPPSEVGHRDLLLTQVDRSLSTRDLVAFLRALTGPLPPLEWRAPPEDLLARDSGRWVQLD